MRASSRLAVAVGCLVTILASFTIGAAAGRRWQSDADHPGTAAGAVHAVPTARPPVLELAGQGIKQTETFAVTAPWTLEWSAEDTNDFAGHFSVSIYDAGTRQLLGLIGNVVVSPHQTQKDSSIGHRAARYYLGIEGTNVDWHVRILD